MLFAHATIEITQENDIPEHHHGIPILCPLPVVTVARPVTRRDHSCHGDEPQTKLKLGSGGSARRPGSRTARATVTLGKGHAIEAPSGRGAVGRGAEQRVSAVPRSRV